MNTMAATAPETTFIDVPRGLKNVVVAETVIGDVQGDRGFFHYRDRNAVTLAGSSSLERIWAFLLDGTLFDLGSTELARFTERVGQGRVIDGRVARLLPGLAAAASGEPSGGPEANPLMVLRTALSAIGTWDGYPPLLDTSADQRREQALTLAACAPTVLAAAWRLRQGLEPIPSDPTLGHAADYLRMVTGEMPTAQQVSALELYLNLTVDHGFNASTFAGRVVASAGSDFPSALIGAIGAFLGPLHGGAPDRALQALADIGDPANTQAWVERQIADGAKIMGFGHAVYRTHDPRAQALKEVALGFDDPLVARAVDVERVIEQTINRLKPGRELYANVEYYAGVVMSLVGLPPVMFTPTFAVARIIGWSANILEQAEDSKIIRPVARYVGPAVR